MWSLLSNHGTYPSFGGGWWDGRATGIVKRRALECYRSEMRPFPHARSLENVEHLARYRGASVGIEAAEAFMVVRDVLR